jgi:nucleoid-associated protein YgaU
MNLKRILLLFILIALGTSVFAQSLKDNPDYRKSVDFKRQSEIAFDEGDYLEAKRLAEESQKHAALSDQWIAMMLNRYKANSALRRFEKSLNSAANINGAINFPEEYAEGKALYEQAYQEFRSESYRDSYKTSLKGIEILTAIVYIPREGGGPLPSQYVVRDLPSGKEDCLWNIAAYDFVYSDPLMWDKLYEANKDKLVNKDNPHLIHPGLILDIPTQPGEDRNGTWDKGEIK